MEIVALHTKLDEIRDVKWLELVKTQEQQLAMLAHLVQRQALDFASARDVNTPM